MSKFFKIFLIFIYTIFSLGINCCEAAYDINIHDKVSIQKEINDENILVNVYSLNDTSVVSSNNNLFEICASKSDKDTGYGIFENSISDNKILNEQFKNYIYKILNSKSHNISPILENEICTRAP